MIHSAKYAGIERYCVGGNSSFLVPRFIGFHYLRCDAVEHYVFILSVIVLRRLACQELLETVESRSVRFGCPYLSILFQSGDKTLHEVEQRVFMRVAVELVNNIVCGVYQTVGIQLTVNLCQPLDVPPNTLTN